MENSLRPGSKDSSHEATTEVLRKMVVAWSRVSAAKAAEREWSWDMFYRQRKCDLLMT